MNISLVIVFFFLEKHPLDILMNENVIDEKLQVRNSSSITTNDLSLIILRVTPKRVFKPTLVAVLAISHNFIIYNK